MLLLRVALRFRRSKRDSTICCVCILCRGFRRRDAQPQSRSDLRGVIAKILFNGGAFGGRQGAFNLGQTLKNRF